MSHAQSEDALPVAPAGLVLPPSLWEEIRAAYGSPGRAYHDLAHVREVLRRFDEVARAVGWARPHEVFLALLFHDAIYVPGATDNEARSAALAERSIARSLPQVDRAWVARLIELTAQHGSLHADQLSDDERLFVDCDMAILGSPPAQFDAYDRAIEAEYAAVPRELFSAGRRRFFERLLARDRIFVSAYFFAQLEAAARANLQRRLASA